MKDGEMPFQCDVFDAETGEILAEYIGEYYQDVAVTVFKRFGSPVANYVGNRRTDKWS